MSSLNKKGMAEIVQIMSLIVLSIIAISLVWSYVADIGNLLGKQLSPVVDCLSQTSRIVSACKNPEGKIEVTLNNALTDDIAKINIIGDNGYKAVCGLSCGTCILQQSGEKTVFLDNSDLQEGNKIFLTVDKCQSPLSELTITQCS